MTSLIEWLAPKTMTHFLDLSGSVLTRKAAILAAWNSRESISSGRKQSAPALWRMGGCRVLACGLWILSVGCFPPAQGRMSRNGSLTLHPILVTRCQSRRLSWMLFFSCSAMIWLQYLVTRLSTSQHPIRPVQNTLSPFSCPLHQTDLAIP
jgi:hypothetical protein